MIRLDKLYIKGFKDPNREINLTFAEGPISVIYGKNGCGKTTLLRVLQAVLVRDIRVLQAENVQQIKLDYTINDQKGELIIDQGTIRGNHQDFFDLKSILFGVNRGITEGVDIKEEIMKVLAATTSGFSLKTPIMLNPYGLIHNSNNPYYYQFFMNQTENDFGSELSEKEKQTLRSYYGLLKERFKDFFKKRTELPLFSNEQHIAMDFITIKSIEDAIIKFYSEGRYQTIEKTIDAFFETLETFEQKIQDEFFLPKDIRMRVEAKVDFIENALSKHNKSTLKDKLQKYINTFDETVLDSKISKALLINILEKAEEANPTLDAVQELQRIFNGHLSYGKKLAITDKEVLMDLGNGIQHELDRLSSGERNLLSMLTLFLMIGQGRNFLMIDEPENSLHLDWQETFLTTISRLNPQAQIIVASHSPAIGTDTNSLVELA